MKRVLFVCLGNICRSPAAEGVFRKMLEQRGLSDRYEVDSAGTYGGHAGELPDPRMSASAAKRGYDLTHRSRKFIRDDFDRFDQIIVMDDSNYRDTIALTNTVEQSMKVVRMAEFCAKSGVNHIPDPYYQGAEGFEYVLDLLEEGCENLLDTLKG